jgi:hypothetical protein
LITLFYLCPDDYKPGRYRRKDDKFYSPTPAELASPDMWKLFCFIHESFNHGVILSRPIIDYERGVYVRQFGAHVHAGK